MSLTNTDELLLKLSESELTEEEERDLVSRICKDSVRDYLEVVKLTSELSSVDSALSVNFESELMETIAERNEEKQELRSVLTRSFRNTFVGLSALVLVLGPGNIVGKFSKYLSYSTEEHSLVADNFQTETLISDKELVNLQSQKNDVTVLVELVDGATKQKEYVTGILRVSGKPGQKATLIMPSYEATVLKEFEKRVAL